MSNAWATYLLDRDSFWKRKVIPDGLAVTAVIASKGGLRLPPGERLESYQLVGEVTAHQGEDG